MLGSRIPTATRGWCEAMSQSTIRRRELGGSAWGLAAATVVALALVSPPRDEVLVALRHFGSTVVARFRSQVTLFDGSVLVPAGSARGVPIHVSSRGDLELDVEVVRGPLVNVRILDAATWTALQKARVRGVPRRFAFDYPELNRLETKRAELSGQLLPGDYYVMIENPLQGSCGDMTDCVRVRVRF